MEEIGFEIVFADCFIEYEVIMANLYVQSHICTDRYAKSKRAISDARWKIESKFKLIPDDPLSRDTC